MKCFWCLFSCLLTCLPGCLLCSDARRSPALACMPCLSVCLSVCASWVHWIWMLLRRFYSQSLCGSSGFVSCTSFEVLIKTLTFYSTPASLSEFNRNSTGQNLTFSQQSGRVSVPHLHPLGLLLSVHELWCSCQDVDSIMLLSPETHNQTCAVSKKWAGDAKVWCHDVCLDKSSFKNHPKLIQI